MKMEEFQTMMEDQEEFEGESILEDFEDFVMGFVILIPYFVVIDSLMIISWSSAVFHHPVRVESQNFHL